MISWVIMKETEHPISITMSMKQYLNSYKNILRFFGELNHERFGYDSFCNLSNPVVHNLRVFFRDNRTFLCPCMLLLVWVWCPVTPCITPHGQMALVIACYRFMTGFPIWAQASVTSCTNREHWKQHLVYSTKLYDVQSELNVFVCFQSAQVKSPPRWALWILWRLSF